MQLDKLIQQSLLWRGFYFVGILLLNVVLSRFLQAEASGQVYFLANLFSFILLPAGYNLESGFTYFASSKSIAAIALAFMGCCWALLAAAFLYPLLQGYFHFFPLATQVSVNTLCIWGICYIVGLMLSNYASVLYYAQGNYFTPNGILALGNFLLVMLLWLLQNYLPSKELAMWGFFVLFLVQGVSIYVAFIRHNGGLGAFQLPAFTNMWRVIKYCSITLLANMMFFLVYKIDYWFVRQYCSKADLGNYIQAAKLGQMLLIVPQILASTVFPQTASQQMANQIGDTIVRLFRLMVQIFALLILLVAVVGKWLFPFVFGSTFSTMYVPMLVLLPGIAALAMLSLMSAFLLGNGKIVQELIGAAIGLVVVVVGDVWLIPTLGIVGAAWVSVAGYTVNCIYILYCFRRLHFFPYRALWAFQRADWYWVYGLLSKKQ